MKNLQSKVPFDRACEFVIELGEAAHQYGSSSPRIELFLSSLMNSFGFTGTVLSTPGEMLFAFQESKDMPQRFHIITTVNSGFDLDKLSRIGDLAQAVIKGEFSLDEAYDRLKEIRNQPSPRGKAAMALAYTIIGGGFAGVLMGSWWDIAFSAVLSLFVYGVVLFTAQYGSRGAEWLPLVSAFFVGLLAAGIRIIIPEVGVVLVVISAIAVLLPGYTISMGVMDFVGGHVISGTINIVNGMVYLVKQVIGGWIGVKLVSSIAGISYTAAATPDLLKQWIFVPTLALGLCLSLNTSKRDLIWAFLGSMIAYLGSFWESTILGANAGNILGTVGLVIYSNFWSRKTGRPTSIVLVPGIVMLVSGSMGFRGLVSIASGNFQQGELQLQQMVLVALTIAAGLVVGNTLSRPKAML